jgi:hypothetical protein
MMLYLLISGSVAWSANLAWAEYVVKNGAGYSESNVVLAIRNFSHMLERCKMLSGRSLDCPLSTEEDHLAGRIDAKLQLLASNPDHITFGSEAENPEVFPPGQGRAFAIQSPSPFKVMLNRTLLYTPAINGQMFPLLLPEAAHVLVTIFAEVVGEGDPLLIESLAGKIARLFSQVSSSEEFGLSTDALVIPNPRRRIQALTLSRASDGPGQEWSSLLLQDSQQMVNLDDLFLQSLPCPGSHDAGIAFGISSLRRQAFRRVLDGAELTAKLEAFYVCQSNPNRLLRRKLKMTIGFYELLIKHPEMPGDIGFALDPTTLRLQVESES